VVTVAGLAILALLRVRTRHRSRPVVDAPIAPRTAEGEA
jgi:hypothetical protein